MSSPVGQVENAMVARLTAATRASGQLKAESYGGQLDDELFGWVRSLPAVWVTFDAVTEFKRMGRRTFKVKGSFEVLTAQRNLVQDDRRLNAEAKGRDVGVYELVEQNKLALVNQDLGLAIQGFTPGAIRSVMKGVVNREAITVLAQSFSTEWMEEYPDPALTPDGDLVTVGLNYLFKPGDDTADSSDVVTTLIP